MYYIMQHTYEKAANPVDELVNTHFDRLVQQGGELIEMHPAVVLQNPNRGDIVHLDGDRLQGKAVDVWAGDDLVPGESDMLAQLGFTPQMQGEGVWVLHDVAYASSGARQLKRIQDRGSRTYAHWNGSNWHVAGEQENSDRPADLTAGEKDAIARIAQETGFAREVVASLGGDPASYQAFQRALAERAKASGDEQTVRNINALDRPYDFISDDMVSYVGPTAYKLADVPRGFYRKFEGEGQLDTAGSLAVQTMVGGPAQAPTHPPYEQIS